MKKLLSIAEVKQEHKITCPDVSLEYFMEAYCKQLLKKEKFISIEVIVTPLFSFIFEK